MIKNFLRKIKDIYSLVTWPTMNELLRASFTVVVVSVIIGGYLLSLDFMFISLRKYLINL